LREFRVDRDMLILCPRTVQGKGLSVARACAARG
jgi:hypothetical protein